MSFSSTCQTSKREIVSLFLFKGYKLVALFLGATQEKNEVVGFNIHWETFTYFFPEINSSPHKVLESQIYTPSILLCLENKFLVMNSGCRRVSHVTLQSGVDYPWILLSQEIFKHSNQSYVNPTYKAPVFTQS